MASIMLCWVKVVSIRGILYGSIFNGVPNVDRHTDNALLYDIGNFKGDCRKIPDVIVVDIFNSDIQGLVPHRPLDYAPKAIKVGDPSVTPKTHPISFTHSPSYAQGAVFPALFDTFSGSRDYSLGVGIVLIVIMLSE